MNKERNHEPAATFTSFPFPHSNEKQENKRNNNILSYCFYFPTAKICK